MPWSARDARARGESRRTRTSPSRTSSNGARSAQRVVVWDGSGRSRGGRLGSMKREKATGTTSRPVKPSKPAVDEPGNPEFEHFEDLTRKLLEVSKRELDEKRNGQKD